MALKIKDKILLCHLKSKIKKLFGRITWGLFVNKGSGSGIFPDPDPGDQKRPDPTGSGSATLFKTQALASVYTASDVLNKYKIKV